RSAATPSVRIRATPASWLRAAPRPSGTGSSTTAWTRAGSRPSAAGRAPAARSTCSSGEGSGRPPWGRPARPSQAGAGRALGAGHVRAGLRGATVEHAGGAGLADHLRADGIEVRARDLARRARGARDRQGAAVRLVVARVAAGSTRRAVGLAAHRHLEARDQAAARADGAVERTPPTVVDVLAIDVTGRPRRAADGALGEGSAVHLAAGALEALRGAVCLRPAGELTGRAVHARHPRAGLLEAAVELAGLGDAALLATARRVLAAGRVIPETVPLRRQTLPAARRLELARRRFAPQRAGSASATHPAAGSREQPDVHTALVGRDPRLALLALLHLAVAADGAPLRHPTEPVGVAGGLPSAERLGIDGGAVLLVHLRRAHQTLRGVPAGARLVAHGRAPHERLRVDARALGRLADLTNTAGDSTRARAASPRGGAARGGS